MGESPWVTVSPGAWQRSVNGDTWTFSARQQGGVVFYTLTGPFPAPTWTTADRLDQGPAHAMRTADDRIGNHYAAY